MSDNGSQQDSSKIGAVMVVGGGISGMQSALDLAESGFKVYLVEEGPSIGGRMAQLDKTFPTNDCSTCIISPKLIEVSKHRNIEIITYADVISADGEPGKFRVKVRKRARYIDENLCVGCGTCWEKCPEKVPSEFNLQMDNRSAIYVPFPQAVPLKPVIDTENCRYMKYLQFTEDGEEGKAPPQCRVCEKLCTAGAINWEQQDEDIEIDVGSIILAPGYEPFDATIKPQYGYGWMPNVVTSLQFERILSASGPLQGQVLRPSDGKHPVKIAWIQCVGSRDETCGRDYCSSVCCMYARGSGRQFACQVCG